MSNNININSANIKIFPFGNPRQADPYGRVLNEQHISNMLRNATDRSSYVIHYDATSKEIQFVIHGYHVIAKIDVTLPDTTDLTAAENVYAYIICETSDEDSNEYIVGEDDVNEQFQGVTFTTEVPNNITIESNQTLYYLHLLTKTSGTDDIPKESVLRINDTSISDSADNYTNIKDHFDAIHTQIGEDTSTGTLRGRIKSNEENIDLLLECLKWKKY